MSLNNQNPRPGKVNTSPRVKTVTTVNPARLALVKESNKGTSKGSTDGQSLNKMRS